MSDVANVEELKKSLGLDGEPPTLPREAPSQDEIMTGVATPGVKDWIREVIPSAMHRLLSLLIAQPAQGSEHPDVGNINDYRPRAIEKKNMSETVIARKWSPRI